MQVFVLLFVFLLNHSYSFRAVPCSLRLKRASMQASSLLNAADSNDSRLSGNLDSLIRWIEDHGGRFDASMVQSNSSWSLAASHETSPGTTLLSIPKKLCLHAHPPAMPLPYPVQTKDLINAIGPQHWRARLAIALLCERCNPHSFFLPYLNNLPQEIRGVPLFFSPTEFRY